MERHEVSDVRIKIRAAMCAVIGSAQEITLVPWGENWDQFRCHMPRVHAGTAWEDYLDAAKAEGLEIFGGLKRFTLRRPSKPAVEPASTAPAIAAQLPAPIPAPKPTQPEQASTPTETKANDEKPGSTWKYVEMQRAERLARESAARIYVPPVTTPVTTVKPPPPTLTARELGDRAERIKNLLRCHMMVNISTAQAIELVEAQDQATLPEPRIVALLAQLHDAERCQKGLRRLTSQESVRAVEERYKKS